LGGLELAKRRLREIQEESEEAGPGRRTGGLLQQLEKSFGYRRVGTLLELIRRELEVGQGGERPNLSEPARKTGGKRIQRQWWVRDPGRTKEVKNTPIGVLFDRRIRLKRRTAVAPGKSTWKKNFAPFISNLSTNS